MQGRHRLFDDEELSQSSLRDSFFFLAPLPGIPLRSFRCQGFEQTNPGTRPG